jgi:hypothetical protein
MTSHMYSQTVSQSTHSHYDTSGMLNCYIASLRAFVAPTLSGVAYLAHWPLLLIELLPHVLEFRRRLVW